MKVFISQPMNGLSDEEILKAREDAVKYLKMSYREEDIEVLQTVIYEEVPKDAPRVWYLGRSIQMLGEADAIYFIDGWQKAKGCIVENLIANLYGIKIID